MDKDLKRIVEGLEGVIIAAKLPGEQDSPTPISSKDKDLYTCSAKHPCPKHKKCPKDEGPCPRFCPELKAELRCPIHREIPPPPHCLDMNPSPLIVEIAGDITEGIVIALSLKDAEKLVEMVRAMDKKGVSPKVSDSGR